MKGMERMKTRLMKSLVIWAFAAVVSISCNNCSEALALLTKSTARGLWEGITEDYGFVVRLELPESGTGYMAVVGGSEDTNFLFKLNQAQIAEGNLILTGRDEKRGVIACEFEGTISGRAGDRVGVARLKGVAKREYNIDLELTANLIKTDGHFFKAVAVQSEQAARLIRNRAKDSSKASQRE